MINYFNRQRVFFFLCVFLLLTFSTFFTLKRSRFSQLASQVKDFPNQSMVGKITNQWYSSLFFDQWSAPLFAYPLAYKLSETGIGLSYPQVRATSKTVFASYTQDILIGLSDHFNQKNILESDPLSVSVQLCSDQTCLSTRFIHGSPVLTVKVEKDTILKVSAPAATGTDVSGTASKIIFAHGKYLLSLVSDTNVQKPLGLDTTKKDWNLAVQAGDRLFIALEPDAAALTITDTQVQIEKGSFNYKSEQSSLTTSLNFSTATGNPPLIALLPHHWEKITDQSLGEYNTLRGQMRLYKQSSIRNTYVQPEVLSISKMVESLTAAQKTELLGLIKKDTEEILKQPRIEAVYDGGKQVFRAAMLFEVAQALSSPDAPVLHDKLLELLSYWLSGTPSSPSSPFIFSEDPKGIVAKVPQYGNEVFNDHHFHYGYFLAGAGILIDHDSSAAATLQPGIKALLDDIASTSPEAGYPLLRGFDPYESHSWADGRGVTNDGNNQESTSEAVNRWYGLYRIALALEDSDLLSTAQTGMAMEQNAAQIYWLGQRPDLYQFPSGYDYPMASLVFGGKLDFATWFSGLPTHIYGIQFLPITPAMTHVKNPSRWSAYTTYRNSNEENAWNDIRAMLAAMNGETVPTTQPKYEAGESASWYYLWVNYWMNQ